MYYIYIQSSCLLFPGGLIHSASHHSFAAGTVHRLNLQVTLSTEIIFHDPTASRLRDRICATILRILNVGTSGFEWTREGFVQANICDDELRNATVILCSVARIVQNPLLIFGFVMVPLGMGPGTHKGTGG